MLAGQWAYGGHLLWRARRAWLLGTAVPTVYLWVADRTAIALGIWGVSPEYTTGLRFFDLPVEEAVFFLMTNLMVVQGLLLLLLVFHLSRERGVPVEDAAWASYRGGKLPAGAQRRVWREDAFEIVLLAAFFALVPPVLAVGLYFCLWHSVRHVGRLMLLDPTSLQPS